MENGKYCPIFSKEEKKNPGNHQSAINTGEMTDRLIELLSHFYLVQPNAAFQFL